MDFKLDITLTDKDYFDYNVFWMLQSPYGKKRMIKYRAVISLCIVFVALISLYGGEFSRDAFMGIIPHGILLVAFNLFLNRFFVWMLKGQLKKRGTGMYSSVSEMEFFENYFTETTLENKIEQRYSSVERISIVKDKVIYIHANAMVAYILPAACFASKEEYGEFLTFIKTKCARTDIY